MHINTLKESPYLKKEDCGTGLLVTIESIEEVNVAKRGEPEQIKYGLNLRGLKPLIMNTVNARAIATILGSEETDDWIGKRIILYHEPNIEWQGKKIGGIRVRAAKKATPQQGQLPDSKDAQLPDNEDDVPF